MTKLDYLYLIHPVHHTGMRTTLTLNMRTTLPYIETIYRDRDYDIVTIS